MKRKCLPSLSLRPLFLVIFFYSGCTYAVRSQQLRETVSINIKDATLGEFIKEMERISGYSFIYGEEVRLDRRITVRASQKPVRQILEEAFTGQSVIYEIQSNHIVLRKKKEKRGQRKHTISGYIVDAVSKESLIGANLFVPEEQTGTATNSYGFFSLTLPEGKVSLQISYIGYKKTMKEIDLNKDVSLQVNMQATNDLKEVVIYGEKAETGLNASQMGALDIPLQQIKNTPALLGETDVMKTIQLMPGVQAGTEGSAGVYVRGGGPDQNLILLDGVPIYNVDHLFGFFSVFTPEAIKKVSLFKSSFPARFGGRLSSVIDVRTNDGDMQHYHGTIGIGLLSSKIQLEGPIIKNRTSFNLSGRRSYWDLVARPFMKNDFIFGYYFYDMNIKLNHIFNKRSRLFFSFYGGRDKFHSSEKDESGSSAPDTDDASSFFYKMNLNWGNRVASLRWNYIFTPQLFSNLTVAYTKYDYQVNSKNKNDDRREKYRYDYTSKYESGIKDLAVNLNFDYHPVPGHHIKFGGGYLYHDFQPEVLTSAFRADHNDVRIDTTFESQGTYHVKAHEASLFAEDNFAIGPRLDLNAGFHLSLFNVQGKTYLSAQPRLSMRYLLSDDVILKGSYTKMNQYIHLLSNYALSMPMDLWVPVTSRVRPMRAHQYSIGIYYKGISGWEFSAESYYKKMCNVLEYKNGASFLGNSYNWEEKVETGQGRSFGVELMAQKTVGRTNGWIAYTLAKSDRKFTKGGINNGERFPYKYDRRHKLNIVLNHKFSDRVDIGASWEFMTGGAATIAEHYTWIYDPFGSGYYRSYQSSPAPSGTVQEADLIEKRNNYRYPASHCLNIGINLHKKTKHGMRTWSLNLYNAYNTMNPTFIYKSRIYESGGNTSTPYRPVIKKLTLLPLIPSVTYTYKF